MQLIQRILLEIFRYPVIGIWHLTGWRISQPLPDYPKMIVTGAPHTSNWDYLIALLAATEVRRRLHVTIKDSLFFPPLGWILKALGGIAIDRSRSMNFVDQVAEKLNDSERMIMIFTPEGTRSHTEYWKTGFYWAAVEANVPIVCGAVNWEKKIIYFDLVLHPTGNIEEDFEIIRAYQEKHGRGLYPENESKIALRPRPTEATAPDETAAGSSAASA